QQGPVKSQLTEHGRGRPGTVACLSQREHPMLRSTRFLAAACLAAGALLGYAAASGKLSFFQRAEAAPPAGEPAALAPQAEEAIACGVLLPSDALLEVDGVKTAETGEKRLFHTPPLKVGGRYNYTLKATAGKKEVTRQIHIAHGAANSYDLRPDFQGVASVQPKATQLANKTDESRKPHILFTMGDDIGWMQPSCSHRGLMVGETPNIDRIAREGGIFMHYYAESSCTAGRCAFVTGMQPYRAGMLLPMLPGAICY